MTFLQLGQLQTKNKKDCMIEKVVSRCPKLPFHFSLLEL